MASNGFETLVNGLFQRISETGYEGGMEDEVKEMMKQAPKSIGSRLLEKSFRILLARSEATNNDREYSYIARMMFALEYFLEQPGAKSLRSVRRDGGHSLEKESMMAIDKGILIEQRAMSSYTWRVFGGFMIPTTFILLVFLFGFHQPIPGVIAFVLLSFVNYVLSGAKARKNYPHYRNKQILDALGPGVVIFCNNYVRAEDLREQEKTLSQAEPGGTP